MKPIARAPDLLADLRPSAVPATAWAAMTEGERCAAIRASGLPLGVDVGPVPCAPGAGPGKVVVPWTIGRGGIRVRDGHAGRSRVERADVFDRMEAAARRAARGDAAPDLPFTPGQVAIGRRYAALVERHDAGGLRCAVIEAGRAGGDGGGATDARLSEAREIAALRRRIGDGVAMAVRRVRPSARGAGAGLITDRALVDAVCLAGQDLSAVLRRHGWAVKGAHREVLRAALAAALDRMSGYR